LEPGAPAADIFCAVRRFTRSEREAYRRSNAVVHVELAVTSTMRECVGDLSLGLTAGDKGRVRETAQGLLDLLSDAAGILPPSLRLKDTAYARFRGGRAVWKLYGTCDPDGTITVAFRTAVRRRIFAFKTFLDTVVHEFMHHYDARKMRLAASFHTSGFFHRVRDLRERLLLPAREGTTAAVAVVTGGGGTRR
jgi:hypothetical protein